MASLEGTNPPISYKPNFIEWNNNQIDIISHKANFHHEPELRPASCLAGTIICAESLSLVPGKGWSRMNNHRATLPYSQNAQLTKLSYFTDVFHHQKQNYKHGFSSKNMPATTSVVTSLFYNVALKHIFTAWTHSFRVEVRSVTSQRPSLTKNSVINASSWAGL